MRTSWLKTLGLALCVAAAAGTARAQDMAPSTRTADPSHKAASLAQDTALADSMAHAFALDSNAFASLLTCGPGNEFYTTFGHTAIRICDTSRHIDVAYTYGMFSFSEPHFYLNFARGWLNYFLGKEPFQTFMQCYAMEGRWVREQRLELGLAEVNRLYELLEENYKPENSYYLYDYFADNCATRVRDMIGNVSDKPREIAASAGPGRTYRSIMYEYTHPTLQWWQLGIDLLLGARTDQPVTDWQAMFAPNELMKAVGAGTLGVRGNAPTQLLRESRKPLNESLSPTLAFWLLAALALLLDVTSMALRRHAYNRGGKWAEIWRMKWLDGILFTLAGLLGMLMLAMWVGTDHYWTKNNWNLLWANPLFLLLAFRLRRNNRIVAILLLLCLVATLALGCTGVLPQQLNPAVLPIALLLTVRTLYRLQKKRND